MDPLAPEAPLAPVAAPEVPKKKSKGRKKIEIKKMVNKNNLRVTFTKRRSGIFNKATEVSVMCDAEVGICLFSPSDKVYTYGTHSFDRVVDRFLNRPRPPLDESAQILEARHRLRLDELCEEFNALNAKLEAKKAEEVALLREKDARQNKGWWEADMDKLNLP